ncbi:Outer membrane receptor proteins, mostly Fe transport [Pedobacter terrae]|uniref:Outer membrane receptor proteins, mostly Fe transport n=1 Tax=Pedobacter terrae TaxID=405671 RepID=A0A1G7VDM4_9SPHI|nr:TonB-dependent receptor [Pedobacter terrae]SDG57844.1 Outer membrane receptor proteins, mostly Fe transport [Pedobacter terrae]
MKIGFYDYIKEYFINLDYRPIVAIMVLCTFLFNQGMASSFAQTPKESGLSINIAAKSIHEALSLLEDKAGFSINYNRSIFSPNEKINLEVKNMPLELILKKILLGTKVTYRFADANTILLYKLPDPVKPGRISGKIFDEKGETLPGASIKIIETGKATQTASDGSYSINAEPGTYTVEISYISFVTQRISDVTVKADKATPLDISLKPDAKGLKDVLVTATYKKASVEGLLTRQKNASEISNGISAEQISRTPDKNIGESLKRISGVSSVDNKMVLVRGIGERYNTAQLDGITLPSTEAQTRNFSFDLIPSNLVDNVVVSKTVTPDMSNSFGGGLIQIATKDIPTENFISFTAGTAYNDQSTGKDFLSHKRGKYDYFGFDDGSRKFPTDLQHTEPTVTPNNTLTPEQYAQKIKAQSQKFTNDNFTMYKYKTAPSQNYQFTIGRIIKIDTTNNKKLGVTGSLNYRNTQNINIVEQITRSEWNINTQNNGGKYMFNTTLAAMLNVGLQLDKNKFSFRNTYSHIYNNDLMRIAGYDNIDGYDFFTKGLKPNAITETDDPTYTDLLQNKLNGQHQVGKVKLEWNLSRTSIDRKEKDMGITTQNLKQIGNDYEYFYQASGQREGYIKPTSRHNYSNTEHHFSWGGDASMPFKAGPLSNNIKTGYFGIHKQGTLNWDIVSLVQNANIPDSLRNIPIGQMIDPAKIGDNGYNYFISPYYLNGYQGKSITQAGYLMLDNRFAEQLRLVWGVRAEYYKYTELRNDINVKGTSSFLLPDEKKWRWLPSANLTYSPTKEINIRAAFSNAVVRPELMDNSQFFRYDPMFDALLGNAGIASTQIKNYDFKLEWFPGLGEIISASAFYKKFDKPVELTYSLSNGVGLYYIKNSDEAKVYGLEFELRKNLGFISSNSLLSRLTLYSNLTLQKADVVGTYKATGTNGESINVSSKTKRNMYGQAPYLINAGLQYLDQHFGFNVAYNKSGRKTTLVSPELQRIEYESPRDQIDAQISYKFYKNRFEVKVNAGNLLNKASVIYRNTGSYEKNPDFNVSADYSTQYVLKPGFTDKFEDGDQIMFSQKFGRTYSTSITYNF